MSMMRENRLGWQAPTVLLPAQPRGHTACFVEIGPGRGDFLFHLARTHPAVHIIGIEIKTRRFITLCHRRGTLDNVSLLLGDARMILPSLQHEAPVQRIYINFPDPWPKRRHAPRRLMQPHMLTLLADTLASDGTLYFTTDVHDYAEEVARVIADEPRLQSCHTPAIRTGGVDTFPTYFAQKWIAAGRTIYSQHYRRQALSGADEA
ncbi:MAG: tRNA (guanosine(46)-N7)-methyltransferase TrmB [Deltaproteobacteria bacterium]|nr:tRNA (guanosine(46)-N7)-methyltransferase TrmB [Deltaproteobacteria bacterium]